MPLVSKVPEACVVTPCSYLNKSGYTQSFYVDAEFRAHLLYVVIVDGVDAGGHLGDDVVDAAGQGDHLPVQGKHEASVARLVDNGCVVDLGIKFAIKLLN